MGEIENSLPAFFYPQWYVALGITSFFWAIVQAESVLTSFDNSDFETVEGKYGVALCRDAIAVNLTLPAVSSRN